MKATVDVVLTPLQLAEEFCEMSDEQQAQFFIEAARLGHEWDEGADPAGQWLAVGRHLRTCSCSTEAAREMVYFIARGSDPDRIPL